MKNTKTLTCSFCLKIFERELRQTHNETKNFFCNKQCQSLFKKEKINCPICDFVFTRAGIGSHIWRAHGEGINHKPDLKSTFDNGRVVWNKGLTKETSDSVKKNAESLSKTFQFQIKNGTYVIRKMGEAGRKKLSIEQSLRNRGGKSKWFEVAGQKVQGTWERNLAAKFEQLDIKWDKLKTHKDVFSYSLDGKIKSYTPDFYLQEFDLFLEVKGYWWGQDKEKMIAVFEQHADLKNKLFIIEKDLYNVLLKHNTKEEMVRELVWSFQHWSEKPTNSVRF